MHNKKFSKERKAVYDYLEQIGFKLNEEQHRM